MTDTNGAVDLRRLALYGEVAGRWNAAGLRYAVVSGLSPQSPARPGRDLDVLVEASQVETAIQLAVSSMRDLGWDVVLKRRPWTTMITGVADAAGSPFAIEIDVFSRLRWFNVTLVDRPNPGPVSQPTLDFQFDPWASFAKRTLMQVLAGQTIRLQEDPSRFDLAPFEVSSLKTGLFDLCGPELGQAILDAVRRKDAGWMQENVLSLRRAVLSRRLRHHPHSAITGLFSWLRDELYDLLLADRAAPILAVVGPDGTGKSSSIQALKAMLDAQFRFEGIVVRHWRPGLLPPLKRLRSLRALEAIPPPGPPRREAGRFGWLRLVYYGVDFALGYLLRDRPQASQLVPIIYDRCLLDMAVDPQRYGLSTGRGVRALWRVLPGPDLVVLITDDVERIQARKSELPAEEIERQLLEWRELESRGMVDAVVEAGASPEATASRLLACLLSAFVGLGDRSRDSSA